MLFIRKTDLWLLRLFKPLREVGIQVQEKSLWQLLLFEAKANISFSADKVLWITSSSACIWLDHRDVWDRWEEQSSGNLWCWKTAFLKAQTHAQFYLFPLKCVVSHIRAKGGGCLDTQPHWGSGRAAKGKQHFSFLKWGCQGKPTQVKTRKLDGQVQRSKTLEDRKSCVCEWQNPKDLLGEEGALNPLPQVKEMLSSC